MGCWPLFPVTNSTGTPIPFGAAVYFTGAGAVALAVAANGFWGLAAGAIAGSGAGSVFLAGVVGGLSGLTPGALYYVDPSTPGAMTTTPNADFVGVALSSTQILLNPTTVDSVYVPSTPGDWAGSPPTNVWAALDRCAALLYSLNGSVGP